MNLFGTREVTTAGHTSGEPGSKFNMGVLRSQGLLPEGALIDGVFGGVGGGDRGVYEGVYDGVRGTGVGGGVLDGGVAAEPGGDAGEVAGADHDHLEREDVGETLRKVGQVVLVQEQVDQLLQPGNSQM